MKPSGNQAEKALRHTGDKMKSEYPDASGMINNHIYIDDCMSGKNNWSEAMSITDDLKIVLARGGFALKGFRFSGQTPSPIENLSEDKMSIKVAGGMSFDKKRRGKRNNDKTGIIPEELTKRQCVGKIAEIFDLTGKITPIHIVAGLKLDIRTLNQRKLQWVDKFGYNRWMP